MTTLPHPHATHMENTVATLLLHGNTADVLNIEVLASRNGWNAEALRLEFKRQEAINLTKVSPDISPIEEGFGK